MRALILFPWLLACQDTTIHDVDEIPTVTFIRPVDGAAFDPLLPVAFCLQIDDDGPVDELTITLESSLEGTLPVGTTTDCDGGNAGFEQALDDGDHTLAVVAVDSRGQAGSDEITLLADPNTPPRCAVDSPVDGDTAEQGDRVDFAASLEDAEDAGEELLAEWHSDLDGVLWSGSPDSSGEVALSTTELSAGSHSLTLQVTDTRGATDACSTTLEIDPCLDDDADGFTTCDDDCDDAEPTAYPGAEEIADGQDNDCDGEIDEGTSLADDDADGWTELDGDCDDSDPAVNPEATDVWYDGVDSDCDGAGDYDADGDGWDSDAHSGGDPLDCDDTDSSVNPGQSEVWYDGVDSDCDGASDYDADGDGYTSDAYGGSDCDDSASGTHPGNTDAWYDGVDADCDGASDYDADDDGYDHDGYGGADCDDADAEISPGAVEVWYDGVDTDCDGASDYDADGDGEDSADHGGDDALDCDDADAVVWSGAVEALDGVDNDCDDYCDEGLLVEGDLVITEIMRDPSQVGDTEGEWFEVYNPGSSDLALCDGWYVEDADSDSFNVTSSVVVPAGGYAVIGKAAPE